MQAYSPKGALITGTKEIIPGEACVMPDSFRKAADGSITYEYLGSTEVDWDGQTTVEKDGKTVFIDADGEEWTADQITLKAA